MKERPILFSGAMVRAILAGTKTQTRRIVRGDALALLMEGSGAPESRCPHGRPGDRLWVREAFHSCPHCSERRVSFHSGGWMRPPSGAPDDGGDRDDHDLRPLPPKCAAHRWKPSIHMPRWASRITLEVTEVRAERLHVTTESDAKAEGVAPAPSPSAAFPHRVAFTKLWDSINGHRLPWASNPWVWVVAFRRVEAP